ncbi:MAG TPA: LysM peptidoglycan-binding domain-containing protein [Gemmatimonadaceae bacterium]|nr:LysM peptidoglycan-binding domain-containing protein [Gemmatimonadaceae bacterium]
MTDPVAEQYRSTQEYQQQFARRPTLTARAVAGGVVRALAWLAIAIPSLVALGVALYAPRMGPRTSQRLAQRELRLMLDRGETVERSAPVARHHWWRYFHPTYGVLAYTDRRLLWVGAVPRALIEWNADEPVAFETRSWAHDSVSIASATVMWGSARGIALVSRDGREPFAVAGGAWPAVREVRATLERRQAVLRADAERERQRQEYQAWLARQPVYHIVRPGDAVISIAALYGLTPDSLRALNALPGDRIRIGQRLLVRPAR